MNEKYVKSSDGVNIHYEIIGSGPVALLFVHGWLGNCGWWENQVKYFSNKYTVVCVDLAGHGKSEKTRKNWSSTQYADDIKAVAAKSGKKKIILVGHSMSGPYVMEAAAGIPAAKAVILVDTFKDPDQLITYEQAEEFMFSHYKRDFKSAVENMAPAYLFSKDTPEYVKDSLIKNFLKHDAEIAVKALEPLYRMDVQKVTLQIRIPVMAINSDYTPTNSESLNKIFPGFDYIIIPASGHYPMLEQPLAFNQALEVLLGKLK
jgi:pimeloyl-ACP methyl ester carboxylesterase